jgi:hypothetical protein
MSNETVLVNFPYRCPGITLFCFALLTANLTHAQELRKRPVLMSAARLTLLCKDFLQVPVGYVEEDKEYKVSPQQMERALGCISYIEGVGDQGAESAFDGRHYAPQKAQLSNANVLVEYFVKYMAMHPEDNELAAKHSDISNCA